jgi:ABC-2 type transport system ATP-binding protein
MSAPMTVSATKAEPAIRVRGLRVSYGDVEVVGGVDLDVPAGEIFAFIGPNGAGKTTTVEILEGFRRRTSGDVSVLGQDPATADAAWRSRIGVVLQESQPEAELSVTECLTLYAGYYPRPRSVGDTLELVGLGEQAGSRTTRLSGGQRRRLDVAMALIGDPDLIFLDEPTTGFDPSARRAAWQVIAGLRDLGKTIFLTTHYMEEAEYLADRIMVIVGGRIAAEGTPATLGGRSTEHSVISFTPPPLLAVESLPDPFDQASPDSASGRVVVQSAQPLVELGRLAAWAEERGLDLPDLQVNRPTLEDVYLDLIADRS